MYYNVITISMNNIRQYGASPEESVFFRVASMPERRSLPFVSGQLPHPTNPITEHESVSKAFGEIIPEGMLPIGVDEARRPMSCAGLTDESALDQITGITGTDDSGHHGGVDCDHRHSVC